MQRIIRPRSIFNNRGRIMVKNRLEYLGAGEARYSGIVNENVIFTERHQLLNKKTWDKLIEVFSENSDDCDLGWRGEFYGKMLRGACLTYMYNGNSELYAVIEYAVRGLLAMQRDDGRLSTYSEEKQFCGWDMWNRKYVITSLIHFVRICKDESLKGCVTDALCRHADHIVEHIGGGEGQREIHDTSSNWLGINSSSILEPFVELYKLTGKERYLRFAEYIISMGGCSGGDLIELALCDEVAPFEYPETKAYETISFFEGVLAYYEATGNKKYLDAAVKFTEKVASTDITIIGCAGCTHEIFDNSSVRQAIYSDIAMQETCVTVTWMRMLARLYLLTGDKKYADGIEISALNALYGSINTMGEAGFSSEINSFIDALPFDSYSPLVNGRRGIATGGFKQFRTGGYYGCCACIGSAGTGIFPLTAILRSESGIVINEMLCGEVHTTLSTVGRISLNISTKYPAEGGGKLTIGLESDKRFEIALRIPDWCDEYSVVADGVAYEAKEGYAYINRVWSDGDEVSVDLCPRLKRHSLNGRTAFTYGALALARDEMKEGRRTDGELKMPSPDSYRLLEPEDGEMIRLLIECEGENVLLVDYASAGKHWTNKNAKISVWLECEDFQ